MNRLTDIILKFLGILLLAGAVLKGWQLVTEPVVNSNLWSYRPFMIMAVEVEIVLGIWFLSGIFKKMAWLAGLLTFSVFSVVTLYKGMTGAESCGCFGTVHINPWITLFVIDIPAVIALVVFRPKSGFLTWPSAPQFVTVICISLITLGLSTVILIPNEPARVTSSYEVLEPETWIGKKLPILGNINIGESLRKDTWIILFYHDSCPDCIEAIVDYEQIFQNSSIIQNPLKIAFIEVPPYNTDRIVSNTPNLFWGRLENSKEWFIITPSVVILKEGIVVNAWEKLVPASKEIIEYTKTSI